MSDADLAGGARAGFVTAFGSEPDGVWAAPGRANVIGEHTDYNEGFVLPVALQQTTRAAVARRDDGRVALVSVQHPHDRIELALADLVPGSPAGWAGYPAGVVAALRDRLPGGVSVLVDGDVPAGMGLSSSAALSCSVALALRDLVAPELAPADLVDVARYAENDFVGAPTGILDQSASLLCTAGHALFLDTRDRSSAQVPLDLTAAGLVLLVVDTGTSHSHATGGYGDRRAECARAAERLGVPALRDVLDVAALAGLADSGRDPHNEDGGLLLRRARHVVTENARVLEVVALLRKGDGRAHDPREIGPILTAGHESLRADFEISTPELDACVSTAVAAGAAGARMVGGGFGGSAIVLVADERADQVGAMIAERFADEGYDRPRFSAVTPSPGARRLR